MEPCDDVTVCPHCGHQSFTLSLEAIGKYGFTAYEDGSSEFVLEAIEIREDENAIMQCRRCGTTISRDITELIQPDEDGCVDEWTRIRSAEDLDREMEFSQE